jgi:hypothetical protein
MSNGMRLAIGAETHCTDGSCGVLRRVVLDPDRRTATHLVVERHRNGDGRLVPLDLVESTDPDIRLRCSHSAFDQLEPAEHLWFPGMNPDDPVGSALLTTPYYGVDPGAASVLGDFGGNLDQPYVEDTVPDGDVEVGRHDEVRATDGHLGSICGVVVEPDGYALTHVLAREGHLWRKHEVAVPVGVVDTIDVGVTLTISKDEAGRIPAEPEDPEDVAAPQQREPAADDRETSG